MRRACFLALLAGWAWAAPSVITGDYMEDRANKVYGWWNKAKQLGGNEAAQAMQEIQDFVQRPGAVRGLVAEGIEALEDRIGSESSLARLAERETSRREIRDAN